MVQSKDGRLNLMISIYTVGRLVFYSDNEMFKVFLLLHNDAMINLTLIAEL